MSQSQLTQLCNINKLNIKFLTHVVTGNWNNNRSISFITSEAYSNPCHISQMELFVKLVSGFQSLTIFAKGSTLDVWQGFEYLSLFQDIFYEVLYISQRQVFECSYGVQRQNYFFWRKTLKLIFKVSSLDMTCKQSSCCVFN